jgi:2-methylcitrate dehydratase PrpD
MARNTQVEADHDAPPITQILARFVATHPSRGWSDAVDHQAHRTFLNWVGCAVGAARHESAEAALAGVGMLQPAPQSGILGRAERVDMASAALVNGITSHTFDFDDTHLRTIIHPAGPVASAVLALAEVIGASGRQVVDALVLGIAASQPIGMREQFGSMTKPFHPGAAARAGLTSPLLAKHGFTASPRALEAPRGYAQVVSPKHDWSEITGELGERFEIASNTYKPFACGIVIHPAIDAATQLRAKGVKAEEIERVELKVHSLVLELTGKKEPKDGLQAKFSVYHGFAAGLIFGRAGETEYEDQVVNREDMVSLRRKVAATVDASIHEDAADMTALLEDGRKVHVRVEHAIGSLDRPMTDRHLEDKFHSLADGVIGGDKTGALIAACWKLGEARDVTQIIERAIP